MFAHPVVRESLPTHSCPVLSFALLRSESEAHPLSFQSSAHSFAKTPGWHHVRFGKFSSVTSTSELSPAESALTGDFRVLTEINRTRPPASPLYSALRDERSVSLLESALTRK